jgi:hypothetical protein
MIEKINSFASSAAYLQSGSSQKSYFIKSTVGNSHQYSFFKNFTSLRPSFYIDGGLTKIKKNEYNILTSISDNNVIPYFIGPATRTGTVPGPLTIQLPIINGSPGSFGIPFSNQSATLTFAYYTQWSTQYEDYSIGADIEVIGNIKKVRLNLNSIPTSFVVLDLENGTTFPSDDIVSNSVGTIIHEITIDEIGLNKYRVKCSYNHNNYVSDNQRKFSIGILSDLDIYGNPINGSTQFGTQFQLFTGDGIIIDRYFSNRGISNYNYVNGWSSDEELTLSFDESDGCPLVVGQMMNQNRRSSSTFVKDSIPVDGYEGVWFYQNSALLNVVSYENTSTPSIFYGEDAYRLKFLPGDIINNETIFNPPGVQAVTNSNTKLRAFTVPSLYNENVDNKIYSFSFFTKYVEPVSGDRIGRYIGISPFCDQSLNSIFKSSYQKTQGPGVNNLYFTTIDLKNKTVVGYSGGLDYIEDLEIVDIPNSGGWVKIVYRCEVADRSGVATWNFALPILALVDSNGIPQIEPAQSSNDDYFIMERLNGSKFRSFFDIQKNPLNTFDGFLNSNYYNFIQFDSSGSKDLNIAFRYKGNQYSVFSFRLNAGGGSQNGNFNLDESLSFVRGVNKKYKLYHTISFTGYHSSVLNGSYINFTNVNSVNINTLDISNSKIISYRKDYAYHVIVDNQEFVLPAIQDIENFYQIYDAVRQAALTGMGGVSAYIDLFTNPSLHFLIPEFAGENELEPNPAFCSNDKIGNLVSLKSYPTEIEIEILKSLL